MTAASASAISRADFGLMQSTLQRLHSADDSTLDVLATGMHLSAAHGHTVDEICAAGLPLRAEIPVPLEPASGATMARNIGLMIPRFVEALQADAPDLVLLLGDRGEMLAGAIAALHLNLPIMHIHGGERSGTVDEPVRHAISKLSHYHCVATEHSRERLLRMGESADNVRVTGAPGLDGLQALAAEPRAAWCADMRLDPARPVALMVFHPVLQEAAQAGESARTILAALAELGCQVVALMPNSDAGSDPIRAVLAAHRDQAGVRVFLHLPRARFAALMAGCDVMIGNSSAGIIEAASFGTPVLNLGSRQDLRERNANVQDLPLEQVRIAEALALALASGRAPAHNVYGDGRAGERIQQFVRECAIGTSLRPKSNAY